MKMQASLLLILQDVTHVIPCTDHDSLMVTSTMYDDVPTIDEIVQFTFGEKIADVSHKYFQVPSRCNRMEIDESCVAGSTLSMLLLGHSHGC